MAGLLQKLFGGPRPVPAPMRGRLHLQEWPAAVYAVGDIHGCLEQAQALEQMIAADAADTTGDVLIVYLGDYVDRGPDSAGVVDFLMSRPPAGIRRECLAGNHEVMMSAFVRTPRSDTDWLGFGGMETLYSYGISGMALLGKSQRERRAILDSHIPSDHIAWLDGLPLMLTLPGTVFVHAGLRPGIALDQQSEDDLLWIRDDFFSAPPQEGMLVVHGHTPGATPIVLPHRICVDTGACATGILSAVRVKPQEPPKILSTSKK